MKNEGILPVQMSPRPYHYIKNRILYGILNISIH